VSSNTWTPRAVGSEALRARRRLWRAVEAQHIASTLRLVANVEEQLLLERLLDQSKPPLPPEASDLHYLLSTPFRYSSPIGSRFRARADSGIWYGAEAQRTACAEPSLDEHVGHGYGRDAFQRLRQQDAPATHSEDPRGNVHHPQKRRRLIDRDEVRGVQRSEEEPRPALRTRIYCSRVVSVGPTVAVQAPHVEGDRAGEQRDERRPCPRWVSHRTADDLCQRSTHGHSRHYKWGLRRRGPLPWVQLPGHSPESEYEVCLSKRPSPPKGQRG